VLVEIHLLGVTIIVIGAIQCFLACTFHGPEVEVVPDVPLEASVSTPIGAR
jgi:hypothetical protein